jgi:hypothetical protein
MRVADLTPPKRRLLRLAGRIEPEGFEIQPGEAANVDELVELGLLRRTTIFRGTPAAAITEEGREALR